MALNAALIQGLSQFVRIDHLGLTLGPDACFEIFRSRCVAPVCRLFPGAVYTSVSEYQILDESRILTGHNILPGLEIRLADVFAELDRRPPPT